jgi:hypothetical protein
MSFREVIRISRNGLTEKIHGNKQYYSLVKKRTNNKIINLEKRVCIKERKKYFFAQLFKKTSWMYVKLYESTLNKDILPAFICLSFFSLDAYRYCGTERIFFNFFSMNKIYGNLQLTI